MNVEDGLNDTVPLVLHQAHTTPTPGDVVELIYPYERPSRDEILREKILTILAGDQEYPRHFGPGKWTWSRVRRKIGGRVRSPEFRRLVDGLIRDGLVVEVWEAAEGWGWREHRHLLVRSDRVDEVAWGRVLRVYGRDDVLNRIGHVPTNPARQGIDPGRDGEHEAGTRRW